MSSCASSNRRVTRSCKDVPVCSWRIKPTNCSSDANDDIPSSPKTPGKSFQLHRRENNFVPVWIQCSWIAVGKVFELNNAQSNHAATHRLHLHCQIGSPSNYTAGKIILSLFGSSVVGLPSERSLN